MLTIVKELAKRSGFGLVRSRKDYFPPDFDGRVTEIIRAVSPHTMTSVERLFALIEAVEYVARANIPGSIVECGVWQGGSMMAVAHALKLLAKDDRDLYLFDTFEGMTRPTDLDVSLTGEPALIEFARTKRRSDASRWCYASMEQVKRNLGSTGYDMASIKFIKGKVEQTIPREAPAQISLLRLDTDWYESTRHELVHLFPRLSVGGVLIIDDYGHWQGCRRATDEYFAENNISILLNRIDYTGRIAVKQ